MRMPWFRLWLSTLTHCTIFWKGRMYERERQCSSRNDSSGKNRSGRNRIFFISIGIDDSIVHNLYTAHARCSGTDKQALLRIPDGRFVRDRDGRIRSDKHSPRLARSDAERPAPRRTDGNDRKLGIRKALPLLRETYSTPYLYPGIMLRFRNPPL